MFWIEVWNRHETVRRLIAYGDDVDQCEEDGITPLYLCGTFTLAKVNRQKYMHIYVEDKKEIANVANY